MNVIIDKEFLNGVAKYARYHHTPQQVLILLNVPRDQWPLLLEYFDDPTHDVHIFYEKGKLFAEQEVDDKLEHMIDEGKEGAGDAAWGLAKRQQKRGYKQLRKDLFGIWQSSKN